MFEERGTCVAGVFQPAWGSTKGRNAGLTSERIRSGRPALAVPGASAIITHTASLTRVSIFALPRTKRSFSTRGGRSPCAASEVLARWKSFVKPCLAVLQALLPPLDLRLALNALATEPDVHKVPHGDRGGAAHYDPRLQLLIDRPE